MAQGDPTLVSVNADGRSADVKVSLLGTGGTYLYDASSSTGLQDRATAKIKAVVVSKGFDATGVATTTTRTVYGVIRQRIPGTTGAAEVVSGSDVIITFGLDSPIYAKDNTGAGNSGTAPVFTFLAGLYTQGGHASTGATLTATNNSTLAYYKPRGQWDTGTMGVDFQRVTGDFTVAFDTQYLHGVAGIACAKFDFTGGTSSHVESATVTSRTAAQRTGSSLWSCAYKATIPLSSYTQGEAISGRCRVYPTIGDAAFDTNDHASDYAVQHNSTLAFICDKTLALQKYAIVDTGGNDSTGVASTTLATARANPYATIGKAVSAGAVLIYVKNQSHSLGSPPSSSDLGYWQEVTQDPLDPGGTVTIATGFPTLAPKLKLFGLTVKLASNLSIFTTNTSYLWCDRVAFNRNAQTLAGTFTDDVKGSFYTNCTGLDPAAFHLQQQSSDIVRQSFDGCDFGTASSDFFINSFWRAVACKGSKAFLSGLRNATASSDRSNSVVKNNKMLSLANSSDWDAFGAATTDLFFVGNLLEGINLVGTPVWSLGQGTVENDIDHVVVAGNNFLGGKSNYCYNDGSTDNTAVKYRRGWSVVANVFGNQEIKSDLFTSNGGANANRVGNWWHYEGTLTYGNFARLSDFPPDFRGIGSVQSTADPLFTDDRSGDGSTYNYNANSGTGGGDYSISSTSPLRNMLAQGTRHSIVTMDGTAIPDDGTGAAGALQVAAASGPPVGASLRLGVGR
jgi:hypothetical protein